MHTETTHAPQAGVHQAEGAETEGRSLAPPSFNLAAVPPPAPPADPTQPQDAASSGQELEATGGQGMQVDGLEDVRNQQHGGLHRHRGGSVVVDYHAPTRFSDITVSAGESMIFVAEAHNVDIGSADIFETRFRITGAAEFDRAGSGLLTKVTPGLMSGNVNLVVGAGFTTGSFRVTAVIRNLTQNRDEVTMNWVLRPRARRAPTTMTKVSGPAATAWVPDRATYVYQLGPDLNGARPGANYAGQTFLERFGTPTALGFTMNDLTATWRAANPTLNTPDLVARNLFDSGGNSTFVIDSHDQSRDEHSGFGPLVPFTPAALASAGGVGYRLPQSYVIGGTVLGRCVIDRRIANGGLSIRKSDPVP